MAQLVEKLAPGDRKSPSQSWVIPSKNMSPGDEQSDCHGIHAVR